MIAIVPAREEHRAAYLEACRKLHDHARAQELAPLDDEAAHSIFTESIQYNLLSRKPNGPGVTVLVALDDERLVGVIAVVFAPLYFSPRAIFANELFVWVDPDARGRGIGRMLFEAAELAARDAGAVCMMLGALASASVREVGAIAEAMGYGPGETVWTRRLA